MTQINLLYILQQDQLTHIASIHLHISEQMFSGHLPLISRQQLPGTMAQAVGANVISPTRLRRQTSEQKL